MKNTLRLVSILALIVVGGTALAASEAGSAAGGLIPPPAIPIPYGGKIVTEINLSDNDVLGIVKQVIPAIGEVIASFAPMALKGPVDAKSVGAIKGIDFAGFAEAISGITNVRVLVARYGTNVQAPELMKQLDQGVVKLGKFSRVVSDVGASPGGMALYAQENKGGYVGYAFDPRARTLYAGRVVGFADFAKLTKWVTDAIKVGIGAMKTTMTPTVETQPEPVPEKDAAPVAVQEKP